MGTDPAAQFRAEFRAIPDPVGMARNSKTPGQSLCPFGRLEHQTTVLGTLTSAGAQRPIGFAQNSVPLTQF